MNKGLEALQEMRDEAVSSICRYVPRQAHEEVTRYFDKRKSIIEKELKAFHIIKKKGVFVHLLQQSQNVEEYNSLMLIAFKKMAERDYKGAVEKFCLTQEEYDSIKEVLL